MPGQPPLSGLPDPGLLLSGGYLRPCRRIFFACLRSLRQVVLSPAPPASRQAAFDAAVAVLEADGGVAAPTDSRQLDGRWRLLFTTRPGTASPIQRTFTAVDSFKSELDLCWAGGLEGQGPG